jgi:hypothetical protein
MLRLKKSNVVKKVKSAHFIGRQLSRLKLGQSYYAIVVSSVSAISLISLAFEITIWMLILVFPILLLGTFVIGYFMDIYNINTMDKLKANEIGNRYLTTSDMKGQEFQLLQTEIVLEALKAIQEERQLDPKDLLKKYDLYFRKWKSPYK